MLPLVTLRAPLHYHLPSFLGGYWIFSFPSSPAWLTSTPAVIVSHLKCQRSGMLIRTERCTTVRDFRESFQSSETRDDCWGCVSPPRVRRANKILLKTSFNLLPIHFNSDSISLTMLTRRIFSCNLTPLITLGLCTWLAVNVTAKAINPAVKPADY